MCGHGQKGRCRRCGKEGAAVTGLERFIKAKTEEIGELRSLVGRDPLAFSCGFVERPSFRAALEAGGMGPLVVVAEFKKASPSKGVISETLEPDVVAYEYAEGGASALSVITEKEYFHGSLSFIDRACHGLKKRNKTLPILRKDFIFDPLQVKATLRTSASAILLIVRLTPDVGLLRSLRETAEAGGMEAVVEVFDEHDLALARESGAGIIQVNARDLASLTVDRRRCLKLAESCPPRSDELWIAASGINTRQHLQEAADAGFRAALVGTSLMKSPHPGRALRELLLGRENA